MKEIAYYETPTVKRPDKRDYTTLYVYDKGECVYSGKESDYQESLLKKTYQKYVDEEAYKAAKTEYHAEARRLETEFMQDLFEEFGVQDHPKRELAYGIAVNEMSWSNKLDIINNMDILAPLLSD